jgi:predicted nucleotidyltransferase
MTEPAVPDVHFDERQIAAVRHVVGHRLGDRVELAYLAGSLAVGLGHGTSDVDVYAVAGRPSGQDYVYEHDGVLVHVTELDGALVRRLAGLGTRFTATGTHREQFLLEFKVLNALVRLTTGYRVKVSPVWRDVLAPLRRDVVRQILVARHANIFAACAEDVWGALLSGDRYTAATASALALESAAEAAHRGDRTLGGGTVAVAQPGLRRRARRPGNRGGAPAPGGQSAAVVVCHGRLGQAAHAAACAVGRGRGGDVPAQPLLRPGAVRRRHRADGRRRGVRRDRGRRPGLA